MIKNRFKLVSFLAISFILATSISCAKEDDVTPEPVVEVDPLIVAKEKLIGKWEFVKRGIAVSGVEDLKDYAHQCASFKDNQEFKIGNSIVADVRLNTCVQATKTYSYGLKIVDGKTVFTLNDVNDYRIISLTDTELKYLSLTFDVGEITLCKKVK
jgi:hypothetical protein